MIATERVINDLNVAKRILCNPQMLTPEICIRIGQAISSAIVLLKEQEAKGQIVQCKDCKHSCLWNERDVVYCNKNIGTIESSVHKPDWFCADGEWKRNGNDVTS